MQKGQLKKVGSSQFFKKFYNSSPKLVFTFKGLDQHLLRETELREVIMNAVEPKYHLNVSFEWNELGQLIFRVPANISW